jgi:hypothetical protein
VLSPPLLFLHQNHLVPIIGQPPGPSDRVISLISKTFPLHGSFSVIFPRKPMTEEDRTGQYCSELSGPHQYTPNAPFKPHYLVTFNYFSADILIFRSFPRNFKAKIYLHRQKLPQTPLVMTDIIVAHVYPITVHLLHHSVHLIRLHSTSFPRTISVSA